MKPDEFEQRLSRQPLRPVPAEWRAEILAAMRRGEETPRCGIGPRSVPSLPAWLATLFWPRPAAWAGLAVVWIFIFALNFSMRDHTPALAEKVAPPSPEMMAQLKQQRRLLVELLGPRNADDADRPKPAAPPPQSRTTGGFRGIG
ncbi:MAG TPA: hypothetical protein VFB55_03455 [Verrucomicrobiae bacterium]|nr:hypothetical protein [Verrucomicrobiae bacterium]